MLSVLPSLPSLRALLLLAVLAPGRPALAGDPTDPPDGLVRVERLANQFTASSQERVALAEDRAGGWIVVWQSRRQEEGGYGIFARRFDAAGEPRGDEIHVNATTASVQIQPVAAVDDEGGVWFAWCSFGQDGDQGAIVARRFDSHLRTATAEIVVNRAIRGEQCEPVIAPLPGGGAFVAWQSAGEESGQSELHARRLAGDGTAEADAFRVDSGLHARNGRAAVAADGEGRVTVVWDAADSAGRPVGVLARRFAADGTPAGEERLVGTGLEPALALAGDGSFVVAWLEAAGEDYAIRMRRVADALGAVLTVPAPGPGHTSGLAVDVDEAGGVLLAWSRYGDGERREAGLFAQRFAPDLSPRGEAFRVTAASEGNQVLAAVTGAPRARGHADGCLAFAWSGDGGLGDESGAHLTLLRPAGLAVAAAGVEEAGASALRFAPREEGAKPHEPPIYDPRQRSKPETDIHRDRAAGDFDFLAVTQTPWTPPDPHMAVGPTHLVVMTNGEIAIFDKLGNNTFRDEIENSFGFWGAQGATNFVFDPEVIYDPHAGRFMAMACERATNGYYLLAISDDSDPNGSWHKYRINATPYAGDTDIDSPNIAVDPAVIYLSADFFGPDKLNILMIDKSSVLGGGTPVITSLNIVGDQSQGFPVTYDAGAPAQYLIGFNFSTSTLVKMYALTDPLGTPALQSVNVTVPSYSHPEDPPQQGTSSRPETFEARFWSAVVRDGHLWATHHVNGTRIRQRWYEFDMQGWPGSGSNPILVQSGEIDLGGTIRTFFGSIWVDEAGNAGLTYARSSPTEFISMERTWRAAGDPLGTTRTPVSVIASTSAETSTRWGDYSAVVDDPVDPAVFWAHHEYRTSGWRTRVARFGIDGGPDPVADFAGAPTAGDEDLLVAFTDLSTGTGLYGWSWTFGDGGTSALPNPSYTYVDPGTYTVSLTVAGTNGSDTETKVGYVVVNDVFDATATPYNGAGINPNVLTSMSLPILGTNWLADIDGGSLGATGLTFLVGYSAPTSGLIFGPGELLIDVSSPWQFTSIAGGGSGISHHSVAIPSDPVFAGIHSYAQGFLNNVGGAGKLTNAYDLGLGY
ncbi:MAG: PKD domain-containing protein [Planctomycetota bacterium]